jgi:CRISPR-associated endonuclease/helicase Cas3
MPPRTRESLPVPVYEVRNWLRNQAAADVADIEGATTEGAPIRAPRNQHRPERRALRWRGPDDPQTKPVGPDDVRPGDTIVVPASCGGADRFGWNPAYRDPVEDVAEACLAHLIASYPHNAFRRPVFHLRLHPSLLPGCDPAARSRLLALLDGAAAATKIEDRDPWPPAARLLEAVKPLTTDRLTAAAITALLAEDARVALYPDGRGVVISAEVGIKEKALLPLDEIEHEEPQEDEASAARRPVPLSKHSAAVRKKVVAFAKACGLDVNDTLTTALRLAAQWHDEGKRDSRFQAWLYGSELKALAALAVDQPLAKSGLNPKRWRSSEAFGYPRGSRHEFVSVRLFEKASEAGDEAGELAKLLIGTHHGCGRAFPRVLKDSNPVTVTLQRNGSRFEVSSDHRLYRLESGWVDLFWKMVRRYGWWGLAYLEALVVAADRLVSADEQRQIEKQAGETGA